MTYSTSNLGDLDTFGSSAARTATINISSYTNGGETISAADVGLNSIDFILVLGGVSDNGHGWYSSGATITAYVTSTDTELASTNDAGAADCVVVGS